MEIEPGNKKNSGSLINNKTLVWKSIWEKPLTVDLEAKQKLR